VQKQFVLGDDEEDLPPYNAVSEPKVVVSEKDGAKKEQEQEKENLESIPVGVHYIQAADTLQGIALSYNISVGPCSGCVACVAYTVGG